MTRAHANETYQGVLGKDGVPVNTPHHFFVDDDVYGEVFDVNRNEQTIAAGIEALFLLLGESDLFRRQDPISWDKLLEMIIHFRNIILSLIINTRRMTIMPPPEYVHKVVKLMENKWNKGRLSFEIKEAETLAGQLAHIANTALWLKHLMAHLYTSIAAALKTNKSYLISTNKHFTAQIKLAKQSAFDEEEELRKSFAQSESARKIHNVWKTHWILPTLREPRGIVTDSSGSILS